MTSSRDRSIAFIERGRASALERSWRMKRQDGSQTLVGRNLDASELKEGSLQGWSMGASLTSTGTCYSRILEAFW